MNMPFSSKAPANLYALLLKLRPLQPGTLMAFSGELVHGAWLNWLRREAPEVSAWLHEGNRRRLFTCSSLQFPLSGARMREAERENVHLPLDPEKTYTIRITLLLGELFPLFYDALMHKVSERGGRKSPFIQLGKQLFLLEEVVMDSENPASWTGFTSLPGLVEQARGLRFGGVEPLTLEFASLTTFSRSNSKNKGYGIHHARLPLTQYVFPGLARRWNELAPPELVDVVQKDRIDAYVQDDGVIIVDYDLRAHSVRFTTHTQYGFIGSCKYHMRGPDEATTAEAPLTVRQQLWLLAQLAFYCGVGYKTAMGLGQTQAYLTS